MIAAVDAEGRCLNVDKAGRFCGEIHDPTRCQGHIKASGRPDHPRAGKQCGRDPTAGLDVCQVHGGAKTRKDGTLTKAGAAGRRNVDLAKARRAVATMGLPRDVDPWVALLEEVHRAAGAVDWLTGIVHDLDPGHVTWGLSGLETKSGGGPTGNYQASTEAAGVNTWVQLWHTERKHLLVACKTAIDCGVAERQVRLAEQHGKVMADVWRSVIADAELGLNVAQQEAARHVIARHLRALPPAA